jgi:hypothetical protein
MPASDYVIIPNGYDLTADKAWIVGNYGLPVAGYVYGVTGLPTGGFSGTCTVAFTGGTKIANNNAAGTCSIAGGNVATFTLTNHGSFSDVTGLTATFTGSGGGSGTGTIQAIQGGGVAAVHTNATGVLRISSALTVRGDIRFTAGAGNTTDAIVGNAGGSLTFDASGAADPVNTRYSYGASADLGYRAFRTNGTSGQHFTVTSNVSGGYGYINPLGTSNHCCSVVSTYTDFSYLGDSIFDAIDSGANTSYVVYDVQYSTFTSVALIYVFTAAASVTRHDYNVHATPTGTADIAINATVAISGGGVREAIGNVFAGAFGTNKGAVGVTATGNYMGAGWGINSGYSSPWASFDGNFVRSVPCNVTSNRFPTQGNLSNEFMYVDGDCTNPHWISDWGYGTADAYDGLVFDMGGDAGYGDGNNLTRNSSTAATPSVKHSLTTVGASGFSSSAPLITFLNGGIKDGQWTIDHNSIESHGIPNGTVDTETNEPSAGQLASLRSNIVWGLAAVPVGYNPGGDTSGTPLAQKFYDNLGVGAVTDVGSPGNLDYNSGWNTTPNCSPVNYANQGKAYCAKYSATPGAHDIDVNPQFVDVNRNAMLFDYYYLGHKSFPAWATGTAYNVGDTVVNPISWFYGGLYVNYRCIAAHTSGSASEPGAARFYFHLSSWIPSSTRGSNWRTYWEPSSLYQLRQGVAAQTKITDGAIGCGACGIIDALRNWVFTGYAPSNPALWCAGHDGETIGAVPFCAKGKAMVAALGGL